MYLNSDLCLGILNLTPLEHLHLLEYWSVFFVCFCFFESPNIRCVLSLLEVKAAGSFITSSFVRLTLRERSRADLAQGAIPEPR